MKMDPLPLKNKTVTEVVKHLTNASIAQADLDCSAQEGTERLLACSLNYLF